MSRSSFTSDWGTDDNCRRSKRVYSQPFGLTTMTIRLRACVLLAAFAPLTMAQTAVAPIATTASAQEPLQEVQVTGERPGPGLWKVSRGDHTLYVLGTLTPLPKNMTWRSAEVERVLSQAQQVIPERADVDIKAGPIVAIRLYAQWRRLRNNPDDANLREVLPPALYARFDALRNKYAPNDRSLDQRRPLIVAGELYQQAIETIGLRLDGKVDRTVEKLAKRYKVPVADLAQKLDDPRSVLAEFGNISSATEQGCLDATLTRLETDLNTLRALAESWSVGDVASLRTQRAIDQEAACWNAITSAPRIAKLRAEGEALWFNAALRSLETNKTSFAVARISRLLDKNGVLEQFAARGYTVTPP